MDMLQCFDVCRDWRQPYELNWFHVLFWMWRRGLTCLFVCRWWRRRCSAPWPECRWTLWTVFSFTGGTTETRDIWMHWDTCLTCSRRESYVCALWTCVVCSVQTCPAMVRAVSPCYICFTFAITRLFSKLNLIMILSTVQFADPSHSCSYTYDLCIVWNYLLKLEDFLETLKLLHLLFFHPFKNLEV